MSMIYCQFSLKSPKKLILNLVRQFILFMRYMRGLIVVKQDLIFSIKEKELQLSKLKEHIDKSEICSDLYNKVLIEKAILTKQLEELQNKSLINRIKHLLPRKEKLICDYFRGK